MQAWFIVHEADSVSSPSCQANTYDPKLLVCMTLLVFLSVVNPLGTWLAQSVECETLDLGVINSNSMLGVEVT